MQKIFVDETIHVAELKLNRGANVVVAHDRSELADDLQAAIHVAPVIVRQFQDK